MKLRSAAPICGAIAVVLLVTAGLAYFFHWPSKAEQVAVQATADTNAATAAVGSAKDALDITVQTQAIHGRIDVITKDNTDAIRHASGATAPVDPDLHATGLRALCMYPAYRDRCAASDPLQLPDTVQPPQ